MKNRKFLAGLFIISVISFLSFAPSAHSAGWRPVESTIYTQSDGPSAMLAEWIDNGNGVIQKRITFKALDDTRIEVKYYENSYDSNPMVAKQPKFRSVTISKGQYKTINGCLFWIKLYGKARIEKVEENTVRWGGAQ